jgi:hypothetical protein
LVIFFLDALLPPKPPHSSSLLAKRIFLDVFDMYSSPTPFFKPFFSCFRLRLNQPVTSLQQPNTAAYHSPTIPPFPSPHSYHLLSRFKDNLLYLHLIKQIIALHSLAQRHYLVRHKPISTSQPLSLFCDQQEELTQADAVSFSTSPAHLGISTSQGIFPFGFSGSSRTLGYPSTGSSRFLVYSISS